MTQLAVGGGGGGRCASLTSTLISGTQSTCCASVTGCSDLRGVRESKKSGRCESLNATFQRNSRELWFSQTLCRRICTGMHVL